MPEPPIFHTPLTNQLGVGKQSTSISRSIIMSIISKYAADIASFFPSSMAEIVIRFPMVVAPWIHLPAFAERLPRGLTKHRATHDQSGKLSPHNNIHNHNNYNNKQ